MEARQRYVQDEARTLRRVGSKKIEGELTEEQIADYKEAFSFFDRDGDGVIHKSDVDTVIKEVGDRTSEGEMRKLREDPSFGTGEVGIGFAEFLSMIMRRQHGPKDEDNEMLDTFELLCPESQRELPLSQKFLLTERVRELLQPKSMGEKISRREMESLMNIADPRGIGRVYLENFAALFRRRPDDENEAGPHLQRHAASGGSLLSEEAADILDGNLMAASDGRGSSPLTAVRHRA
ncbi:unnamed protein product [Amoebophrya sp. A120]|nr:unnamed protein product [Amoebophrya sp. A120]|eukprot:GSA120T00021375001.1